MICTEDEAKKTVCPFLLNVEDSNEPVWWLFCTASNCMEWIWMSDKKRGYCKKIMKQ